MDVYTDGSCITGPDGKRYAGCGIWFGEGSLKNTSIPISIDNPTNQYAELLAVKLALRFCKNVEHLSIFTDSMYSINCITLWYDKWERDGWKTSTGNEIVNLDIIKECKSMILARDALGLSTSILHVKGHSTNVGNTGADALARAGSTRAKDDAMSNTIFFANGSFSQFHNSPFMIRCGSKRLNFNCCEQWYQYSKAMEFNDTTTAEKIYGSLDAMSQKMMGGRVKGFDESIWSTKREDIVIRGNKCKFTQNIRLKELLLSTKGKRLVEARPDSIWGIGISRDEALRGKKWNGLNLLGKCLMIVRDSI